MYKDLPSQATIIFPYLKEKTVWLVVMIIKIVCVTGEFSFYSLKHNIKTVNQSVSSGILQGVHCLPFPAASQSIYATQDKLLCMPIFHQIYQKDA